MAPQLTEAAHQLGGVLGPLAACALAFALLAALTKGGRRALADGRAAAGETRINAIMVAVDALAVSPLLSIGMAVLVGSAAAPGCSSTRRLCGRRWAAGRRWRWPSCSATSSATGATACSTAAGSGRRTPSTTATRS